MLGGKNWKTRITDMLLRFTWISRLFGLSARRILQSWPALVLGLCIALLLSYELWRSHGEAVSAAEGNASNLVHLISEQVARTLQSVDVNLQDITTELERNPAIGDNDVMFRANLHRRLSDMPFVRAIFVINRDGYIIHDTDFPSTPHVSLADREYFKVHQTDRSLGLHIGKPLKSRSLGVWFISMSRRIESADGRFMGIVVAAVEPLYFESFYRQLSVGAGTTVLFLDNGTLLARSPAVEQAMGRSFADSEPFRSLLAIRNPGVGWNRSPIDGVPRILGYQRLERVPIVVLVTLDEDYVMRPWRAHALVVSIGAAILLALLVLLEWLARRGRRREEAARLRLEKTRRLEALGRFAGGIAHDCGNLMRIIRSATVVLRPIIDDRREAVRLLAEIDTTLDAGRTLVNRLLTYARNPDLHLEHADVCDLVREVLPIARQAAGPGVEIRTALSEENNPCRVDRAQFQAAIINLVLNARDAMPYGGRITIGVGAVKESGKPDEAGWVEISVEDEGAGMTDEVQRQAFDPFFTTREDQEGHGMGLSQVQEFVQQSAGRMDIASQPGQGTKVCIRLPLQSRLEIMPKLDEGMTRDG